MDLSMIGSIKNKLCEVRIYSYSLQNLRGPSILVDRGQGEYLMELKYLTLLSKMLPNDTEVKVKILIY
jgi:hypothetical protein